jgi:hypothetical protein
VKSGCRAPTAVATLREHTLAVETRVPALAVHGTPTHFRMVKEFVQRKRPLV